jgi:hypothetical protein
VDRFRLVDETIVSFTYDREPIWFLTCDTLGGLERVRVADLGVCRLLVADLRTNTGSQ